MTARTLGFAVLGALALQAPLQAHADWHHRGYDGDWRGREWRENHWRHEEWREHAWRERDWHRPVLFRPFLPPAIVVRPGW
jgi:hypothetical protein